MTIREIEKLTFAQAKSIAIETVSICKKSMKNYQTIWILLEK